MELKLTVDRRTSFTLLTLGILGVASAFGLRAFADPVAIPNSFSPNAIISASQVNANFAALRDAINETDPKCPPDYTRDAAITPYTVCKKGADEIVRVGRGASGFWMDRYEASVYSMPTSTSTGIGACDSSGTSLGQTSANYPVPANGQWAGFGQAAVCAVSKAGVLPSARITWFQASLACRMSGKHLPTRDQWLVAASGTVDGQACNISNGVPRATSATGFCISAWGAQDMIGNLWEWTDEWFAGLGAANTSATWPSGFGGDMTSNIVSSANPGGAPAQSGLPSAGLRGGYYSANALAGVFALHLNDSPSNSSEAVGFRCSRE